MTFSHTSAFWYWEDWELQLDWVALRGVNLPLAWVGAEKIVTDAGMISLFGTPRIHFSSPFESHCAQLQKLHPQEARKL